MGSWVVKYFKSKKFNIHFCRYEDLISNPKEEFKKILNFYEITLSENIIDNIILKTKVNQIWLQT